jgi:hypothetical protein
MKVVYARTSGHIGTEDGLMRFVRQGSHWPAEDPLVRANLAAFSADPKFGLCYTIDPVEDDEVPAAPVPAGAARRRAGAA